MGCASNRNQHGFTLVEIAIVMIIIGLLVGGTFGGMKLIENMQINSTVQMLTSIESSAITFKDTFGRLPGDMPNTAARLPNCTAAPCTTGGNGDRRLDSGLGYAAAIADTNERFTFWHHLQAAGLTNLGIKNTLDMSYGEGQPETAIGIGLRMTFAPLGAPTKHGSMFTNQPSNAVAYANEDLQLNGRLLEPLERKIDDGRPHNGRIWVYNACYVAPGWTPTSEYDYTGSNCGGSISYRF